MHTGRHLQRLEANLGDDTAAIKAQMRANEKRMSDIEAELAAFRERTDMQMVYLRRIDGRTQSLRTDMDGMQGVIRFGKWLTGALTALLAAGAAIWRGIR